MFFATHSLSRLVQVAFDFTFEEASESGQAILKMSRISALMVLAIYCLYFVHEIRSRSSASSQDMHAGENADLESNRSIALPELPHVVARGTPQPLPPRTIRFEDESVDSAAPGANAAVHKDIDVPSVASEENLLREDVAANDLGSAVSSFPNEIYEQESRGREIGSRSASHARRQEATSTDAFIRSRPHSRSISSVRGGRPPSRESSTAAPAWAWERQQRGGLWSIQGLANGRASTESLLHERPTHLYRTRTRADKAASIFMLFFSSGLMSLCAEFLVGAIDDVTHQVGLSESFIGLIILPIVGNLAEYVTVVSVATRAKLDLAVAVAVGSSIQIALCVSPLTILAGWAMHRDLSLTFDVFEMATLLGTVLLVNLLVLGGGNTTRTNGLKGSLMCACYTIIRLVEKKGHLLKFEEISDVLVRTV
jgi:Ca2+:H+ antiporter